MERYNKLSDHLKNRFGCKVYKLSISGNMSCPNRDKAAGKRGCIFCTDSGSGEFCTNGNLPVTEQIERAKKRVEAKTKDGKYIAYFQNFTNTYAPIDYLRKIFTEAINHPDIVMLSIATRPDCLGDDVIGLLRELNAIKPVSIELGLQTIHEKTAEYIRRGYKLPVFEEGVKKLQAAGLETVVHLILGLPEETKEMMLETTDYVGKLGLNGVKFHLLYVAKNTDLYEEYLKGRVTPLSLEEYADILANCISRLPRETVIHRITGDGAKKDLIAPLWSADKKRVLNYINRYFDETNLIQGE